MQERKKGTERIAYMLAAATAGISQSDGPGGIKGPNKAMDVLAALGMSKASHWGAMLLLASYQEDPAARKEALHRAIRYVWNSWLTTADPRHTVTVQQIRNLADMALTHHCHPIAARQTTLKAKAVLVGVGHEAYTRKFKAHYQRLSGEMQYEEGEAARLLLMRL